MNDVDRIVGLLKDEAKPEWMAKGIPYLDREKPEAQAWRPQ